MFSSATQPRHNFVVSAITFEGFKLLSANLTYALFIQISRTSSIIDIVVPFCPKKKRSYVSIWNGMKCDRKWFSDIQNGRRRPFCQKIIKMNKVPYGSEMARNAIESEFRTSKMADRSEMARNAIQSDFRTSKMAAGIFFNSVLIWNGQNCDRKWISEIQNGRSIWNGQKCVKNFQKKKSCISIWNGQKCDRKWISDIQNGRRQPICQKFHTQIKVAYWSEMARNVIKSEFRTSNITKIKIVVLIWNGKKCDTKWFLDIQNGYHLQWPTTTWYKFTFGQLYIHAYRQLCWERVNIHCDRPLGRMPTILVDNVVGSITHSWCNNNVFMSIFRKVYYYLGNIHNVHPFRRIVTILITSPRRGLWGLEMNLYGCLYASVCVSGQWTFQCVISRSSIRQITPNFACGLRRFVESIPLFYSEIRWRILASCGVKSVSHAKA